MEAYREQLLLLISTPLYLLVIGLEVALSNWKGWNAYTRRDSGQNLYLMLANSGIDLAFRGVYIGVLTLAWQHRWFDIATPWLYWTGLVLAEDFLFYWLHRVDHHCRFFWAVHVTHHSSEKFNLTVGFRSSVFQPLYRFVYFLPLAFLGFRPLDIVFVFSATQIWGILVHTEHIGKLGWLEWVLVTPSHHRVHHASNALYLDRNLGMLLIVWDRLFGTFEPEAPAGQYEPIRYGLTKPVPNRNAWNLIFHEWTAIWHDVRQAPDWRSAWQYVFGPPGWSHDGRSLTSDQLREKERANV